MSNAISQYCLAPTPLSHTITGTQRCKHLALGITNPCLQHNDEHEKSGKVGAIYHISLLAATIKRVCKLMDSHEESFHQCYRR